VKGDVGGGRGLGEVGEVWCVSRCVNTPVSEMERPAPHLLYDS
jgi:hypothetical protein